jgi:hypothetical protein
MTPEEEYIKNMLPHVDWNYEEACAVWVERIISGNEIFIAPGGFVREFSERSPSDVAVDPHTILALLKTHYKK